MSLLLPSELKHHIIAELSSPSSLAALARTHTTFQREAEKALYHSLVIFANDDSLKCLETLATNSEKAALVRFLIVEYAINNYNENRKVTTYLTKSLINMHALSDLRVKARLGSPDTAEERRIKGLCKILCAGHFRLKTLYWQGDLDIPRIIKSQTDLQILGFYDPRNSFKIIKTLKKLHDAQVFLPIVVTLECESFLPYATEITIFPALYSVDRCDTICQALTQSFCKDQGYYLRVKAEPLSQLSIYSSDIPSIYALAKEMAVSFPNIHYLDLWFKRRCEIPPQMIKEEFSFFPDLYSVNTHVWTI